MLFEADSPPETTASLQTKLDGTYAPAASATGRYDEALRTSGSITVNAATWEDLDTGLDLVIAAAAGQVIEVGLSGATGTQAIEAYFDIVSIVGGNPFKNWSQNIAEDNGHGGNSGWICRLGVQQQLSGSVSRAVAAGDIEGGNVTLRVRVRTNGAADRTVFAVAAIPLKVWAINHG